MEETLNYLKNLFYGIFIFLGMKTDAVLILFILMMADSGLGIIKALRLGEKFSFKVLGWGIVIKLSMLILPMILALMAKALSFDFTYFVLAVINIIIVSEGLSCITNILSIKTKKRIENADYATMLIHAIKKGLTKIIEKLLKTIEEEKNGDNT